MPSNVPEFKNVRYKRLLQPDDEKGLRPFVVVTEEVNCWLVWHVTSKAERLVEKCFELRDPAIEHAVMYERGNDE